jgi:membrane fusion protein (multidrug efflux system)
MIMKRELAYLLIVLLLPLSSCGKEEVAQTGPPDIPVFKTETREVPVYQEFVGQVYGLKDIAIRARVEGYLEGIFFEEGSRVEKGKLLYVLESQPFEADVAAKMSKLAEAKTVRAKAESDLNRIRPLAEQRAVSESDLDAAEALHEASIASVEAAEANLRAARIQLGYTKIYSPIKGIIGKTQAKVGDFVGREPNPVILNVVSRIDTILVQFFITETQYLTIARHTQIRESRESDEPREARLELILADGSLYEHKGMIDFIDRGIDPTTGAILLQASFPNPSELLRPGQFARIKALVLILEDGILVPQRCVSELQGLYRVFVVNKENKIELREVKVGPKVGSFWLITEGLGPDEMIVYEGLQKVRSDAAVNPVPVEIDIPVE